MSHQPVESRVEGECASSRGSALLLSVFVLVLLAGMGIVLLSLSQNEVEMSKSNLQAKSTFYLAEAGLEHGRQTLAEVSSAQLIAASLANAAGSNGEFDFDVSTVRPLKSGGELVGFTGYGDDVPLSGPTKLGDGLYMAFLTNDPADDEGESDDEIGDTNGRVLVTGIGASIGDAMEIVQAVVVPDPLLPSIPPCTVMMLGPTPDFYGGDGNCSTGSFDDEGDDEGDDESDDEGADAIDKTFWGTDCAGSGGVPGHYVPTICVQACGDYYPSDLEDSWDEAPDDEEAEAAVDPSPCYDTVVELAIAGSCPNAYVSGPYSDADVVADLMDPVNEPTMGASYIVDERWLTCDSLLQMAEKAEMMASDVCRGACDLSSGSNWVSGAAPTTAVNSVIFVDGDLTVGDGYAGRGLLWVTGTLNFHAGASWNGPILAVGAGSFVRTGVTGSGVMQGASVVANTLGADGVYGTSDDCDAGFGIASFQEAADSTGDTLYCTDDLNASNPTYTFEMTSFRQR